MAQRNFACGDGKVMVAMMAMMAMMATMATMATMLTVMMMTTTNVQCCAQPI